MTGRPRNAPRSTPGQPTCSPWPRGGAPPATSSRWDGQAEQRRSPRHGRDAPKADEQLKARSAMCRRLQVARKNFTSQAWSVQPCVRPVSAVHMTAGHNALRGPGPGQKPAFDNALAHVGCPDRRIDRLCITCCSSSQPSHHAGWPARSRSRRERDGLLVALTHRLVVRKVNRQASGDLLRAPCPGPSSILAKETKTTYHK